MSGVLLNATDVAVERGERQLLTGVTLTVSAGELWQVTGANGLGKTSLLRGLAGLSRFGVTGDIRLMGPVLYLGHLPANKPLLSPIDNLRWHPSGRRQAALPEIETALAAVGLVGFEDSPLNTLSAGQQRRVALARLWLSSEPLWLLDEPFTAVDIDGVQLLERRLVDHVETGGAVVFTSHQPNRFGDRVKVLKLGEFASG